MFLKNAWYVAANDHEIGRHLHATRILGEDIVLYRTLDGGVSALEDACPHRKLPLSMGRLLDDTVECGYHGLGFDCSGRCVRAPGLAHAPARAVEIGRASWRARVRQSVIISVDAWDYK